MKDVGSRQIKCGDSELTHFRGFNLIFKTSKKIVKFVRNFVFHIYLLFYSSKSSCISQWTLVLCMCRPTS